MRLWRLERDGIALSPPSALEEVDVPAGTALVVHSPGPRRSGEAKCAPQSDADAAVADIIKSEADRRGMTRKRYVEWMTRRLAQIGA